jgi:hypothetical protein
MVGLTEGNPPIDHLGCAGDDEERVAVLFELGALMRVAGILDGEIMQAELRLDLLEHAL